MYQMRHFENDCGISSKEATGYKNTTYRGGQEEETIHILTSILQFGGNPNST
jgi:hypothetical protein